MMNNLPLTALPIAGLSDTTGDTPDGRQSAAALDDLAALHGQTIDSLTGFKKMVEKAEPEFRPTVQAFSDLHEKHASTLAQMLAKYGRNPDDDGSFMGTINRAVISIRAAVDEIDADTMKQIRSGEEHVLSAFDKALASDLTSDAKDVLVAQRSELQALLAAEPNS